MDIDMIDKSIHDAVNSDNEDYIMRTIRQDYLSDSTVTIHLIGPWSSETAGWEEQKFIKRELQASLYNGYGNKRSGILGIVLPEMYSTIYRGQTTCLRCNGVHNMVLVENVTIKEFSYNYYIPNQKCSHSPEDRYCILVKWDDFIIDPEKYIEDAYQKKDSEISSKVKVYP